MRHVFRSHLTYANVAATMAVVFAMAGGAVAATHYLITSAKQISPKVLRELKGAAGARGSAGSSGTDGAAGERGERGERGEKGEAGPEGKIGPVGTEGPQGNAGGPAAHWRKTIEKAGASKTAPEKVTLETVAPFTIVGRCYVNANEETVAETDIESSEEGAVAASSEEGEELALKVGEEVSISPEPAESANEEHEAVFKGPYGGLFSAESKTGGVALDGAANEGVFLGDKAKPACSFSGYVVSE